MADILISEQPTGPEAQRTPSPERMATAKAIAEVDGVVDGYRRLKSSDKEFVEKSKLAQSGLRIIVGNAKPNEPGYRQADTIVESVGAQVRSRLLTYESQLGKSVNTGGVRSEIDAFFKQLIESKDPEVSQKLIEQATQAFENIIKKVDEERDGTVQSRKTVVRSAEQQATQLQGLRKFQSEFSNTLIRKGQKVNDDITGEAKIVDLLDQKSKVDREQRKQRFSNYLSEVRGPDRPKAQT